MSPAELIRLVLLTLFMYGATAVAPIPHTYIGPITVRLLTRRDIRVANKRNVSNPVDNVKDWLLTMSSSTRIGSSVFRQEPYPCKTMF